MSAWDMESLRERYCNHEVETMNRIRKSSLTRTLACGKATASWRDFALQPNGKVTIQSGDVE